MLTSTFSDQDVISNVSNIYNLLNNHTVRHLVYMILFYPHNKNLFSLHFAENYCYNDQCLT